MSELSEATRVLGVDPGSQATGWGVVAPCPDGRVQLVACGCIRPPQGTGIPDRLVAIHEQLAAVIAEHQPQAMGIETAFHGRNAQSALRLGECRAVALLTARQAGLEVREYAPARIKKALTGRGNARKGQVRAMVLARLAEPTPELPASLDTSDALATAICLLNLDASLLDGTDQRDDPAALARSSVRAQATTRRRKRKRFTADDLARRGLI